MAPAQGWHANSWSVPYFFFSPSPLRREEGPHARSQPFHAPSPSRCPPAPKWPGRGAPGSASPALPPEGQGHSVTEPLRLVENSKLLQSSRHPNITPPAEPCPQCRTHTFFKHGSWLQKLPSARALTAARLLRFTMAAAEKQLTKPICRQLFGSPGTGLRTQLSAAPGQ